MPVRSADVRGPKGQLMERNGPSIPSECVCVRVWFMMHSQVKPVNRRPKGNTYKDSGSRLEQWFPNCRLTVHSESIQTP